MMNILVSGAGIAGPTLAYWLRQAGHEVTVVERAPDLRTGGQAVDLRGVGRTVVDRMGLMPRVSSMMLEQRGMSWVDARGRARARMTVDAFDGEGFISEIEILRGDLVQILFDLTQDEVGYVFDDTITALVQDDGGVDVEFLRSASRRFDLVIGADGLGSVVRRSAFGEVGKTSLDCGIAWFTVPDPGDLGGWYEMFPAGRGRVASIRPGRVPGEAKASLGMRIDARSQLPGGRAAQQAALAQRFDGVGGRVPSLLAAMGSAPDFSFAEIGQIHLPSWSHGRIALIGDAAASPSPLTGLGTSVALVQAYVLAGELARAGGDHRRAFQHYEEICRPYVTEAQQLPPGGAAGFAPDSRLMIGLQVLSMRLAGHWPIRAMLAKQFAKAAALDLPDYLIRPSGRVPG